MVKFTEKQIKMAYGIINDKRYKGGNMTAATRKIEQIAKGLSQHPGVQKAMRVTNEAKVDGVEKGSLEGDKHMCASKIMHKEWNEGTTIFGEHAEPDENGHVAWYSVMFEHGIETVHVDDENVEILVQESHGGHKKMKKESFLSFNDFISEKKKLSPAQLKHMDVDDDNDIDAEDLAKLRAKKKEK
jgi:hypothetical protein